MLHLNVCIVVNEVLVLYQQANFVQTKRKMHAVFICQTELY